MSASCALKMITQRKLTSALSLLAIHQNHVSVILPTSKDHSFLLLKSGIKYPNAFTMHSPLLPGKPGFISKAMVSLTLRKHCHPEKSFSRVVLTQLGQLHTYVGGMTDMNPIIEAKTINSRPFIPELKNILTSHFTTIKKETLGAPKARRDLARVIQLKP